MIFVTIIAVLIAIYCVFSKKKNDDNVKIQNDKLIDEYNRLIDIRNEVSNSISEISKKRQDMLCENNQLEIKINERKNHLQTVEDSISSVLENQTSLSKKAFENYCEILDNNYKETEEEYDLLKEQLKKSYTDIQLQLLKETNKCQEELDQIKATRAAAIEAERREKMIEDNLSSYCLVLQEAEKADIAKLESLKPSLNKPRVLSMLIWQTWFQKPLKSLSASILGTGDKMGIYKITNIKTKECYIGQAVNIKDRWAEHVKCGLGIDTPAGNKLYKAMSDYGVWNFSFEIIEECSREQLNEKERYYISLYNSYEFGYNSNRGNK